jgi:2-C-methyl-D-erythritol 2,4-cyclodiphosphate synthase
VKEKGYRVNNVDVSILTEEPRLAPYIGAMKENLALALEIKESQASVKAMTKRRPRCDWAGRSHQSDCRLNSISGIAHL